MRTCGEERGRKVLHASLNTNYRILVFPLRNPNFPHLVCQVEALLPRDGLALLHRGVVALLAHGGDAAGHQGLLVGVLAHLPGDVAALLAVHVLLNLEDRNVVLYAHSFGTNNK